jgi:hypothetical protein
VNHSRIVGIDSASPNVLANVVSDIVQGDCSMNSPSNQRIDVSLRRFAHLHDMERDCPYCGAALPMRPFIAAAHDQPRWLKGNA